MKRILFWILAAAIAGGQINTPVSVADISGDGMVHAIASAGTARWIQFRAGSNNANTSCSTSAGFAGCPRIGDANISTSRGLWLLPGEGWPIVESSGTGRIPLNSVYYLVQSGDKLTILYGQ